MRVCRSAPAALFALSALVIGAARAAPPDEPLWTERAPNKKPLVVGGAPSFWPIVKAVEPAVLVVFTEGPPTSEGLPPGHPPVGPGPRLPPGHGAPGDDGARPDDVQRGQGAGFLITSSGYALTNHHVVEGATRVAVSVGEQRDEIECDVVGTDEKSDVAVLKLRSTRTDWPSLALADSDAVRVGDVVVAIGSPFGLAQSVSQGIVSARGRRDIAPSGRQGLYDFLQTDASINPGNSGGPLLDVYGAVVGINSAVNAAGAGIGFAIPINQVKRMLPSIVATGSYRRSWIGVSIASVEPAIAKGLGLAHAHGALVREVVKDGPGAAAGLAPGDVIVRFDGKVVHEANELPLLAGDAGVDAAVRLDVVRDQKPIVVSLVLQAHPDNVRVATKAASPPETPAKERTLGLTVVTLDDEHRARLGVAKGVTGARVTRLVPGGPAFMAGLAKDDVIVKLDGADVTDADAFAAAVRAAPQGAVLKLLIQREGNSVVFAAMAKP